MKLEKTDIVTFDHGMGELTISIEEISKALYDLTFMDDAVLTILNPALAEKSWDFPFDEKTTRKHLLEYYQENKNWCSDSIAEFFETNQKETRT